MRLLRLAALLLLAAIAGCAEGGVTGTGIASVSGNIVQISDMAAVTAALPFAVRVTVEQQPSATATTDADGTFTVRGGFSGAVTLQFSNADDGSPIGPLSLEVPVGSSTVLENIEIRTGAPLAERVRPRAVRQLDVFGRLDMIECADDGTGTVLVSDAGRPSRQFLATLTADTIIHGRNGASLTCAQLRALHRPEVRVEGLVRLADQTIVATFVMVTDARPSPPAADVPRPERIQGVVMGIDCQRGELDVAQDLGPDQVTRVVRIEPATEVLCAAQPPVPCTCADIGPGEPVTVHGDLTPGHPGEVVARRITLDAADAI
jgi:hypothetical protein